MTEIDGKKYYDWNEIRAMPLGTKFMVSYQPEHTAYFERLQNGFIGLFIDNLPCKSCYCNLVMQDRFELVKEAEPEREYVDGPDALRKLMNGEWKKIACDDKEWDAGFLNVEYGEIHTYFGDFHTYEAIGPKFLKLKRWYEGRK